MIMCRVCLRSTCIISVMSKKPETRVIQVSWISVVSLSD